MGEIFAESLKLHTLNVRIFWDLKSISFMKFKFPHIVKQKFNIK